MPTTHIEGDRPKKDDLWSWPRGGLATRVVQYQAWPAEVPSLQRCFVIAFGSALVVLALAIVGQWVAYRGQIHSFSDLRLVGSMIAAVATGVLVFRVEMQKRAQSIAAHSRFEIIGATNHHVRNALQVVIDSKYFGKEDERHLQDAIQRIHWVLTHVLPRVNL
jgi:hypothetical protein